MNPETAAQIQTVRKFGTYFHQLSLLAGALLVLVSVVSLLTIVAHPHASSLNVGLGAYTFTSDQMATLEIKAWSAVVVITVFATLLGVVLHLRRLFRNLAAGSIYTRDNVRHLRNVGTLAVAMAALQIVLPMITEVLVQTGFLDPTLLTFTEPRSRGIFLLGPSSLSAWITAGLVLLASWIMDLGRQTTDEANAMRREANLVI